MLWFGIALVVLALVLRLVSVRLRRNEARQAPSNTGEPRAVVTDVADIDASVRAEIDQLLAAENKIAAIKRLREAVPGLGLADAKKHIDAWGRGTPRVAVTGQDDALDAESLSRIDELIADEQLIPAIKLVRERTGWGLREAKIWVDTRAGR